MKPSQYVATIAGNSIGEGCIGKEDFSENLY